MGRASIGLRDLRRGSPTEGLAALVELGRERPGALVIPRGVAHGFYFHEPSLHVYAVSEYWNPSDELSCHWADSELAIPWPTDSARVSERDDQSPPLSELLARLEPGNRFEESRQTGHREQPHAKAPGDRGRHRLQLLAET